MTVFEYIQRMDVHEFASFLYGVISSVEKRNDAVLTRDGIDFTRIKIEPELQIQAYINVLQSELDGSYT